MCIRGSDDESVSQKTVKSAV